MEGSSKLVFLGPLALRKALVANPSPKKTIAKGQINLVVKFENPEIWWWKGGDAIDLKKPLSPPTQVVARS